MGQQQSTPVDAGARVNAITTASFSEIERYTYNKKGIESDGELMMELGLGPGSGLSWTSAQFLAAYPDSMSQSVSVHKNIFKVLGFYTGRLVQGLGLGQDEFLRVLFLSLAVKATGDPVDPLKVDPSSFYIPYTDFFHLVTLLCANYDLEAAQYPMGVVGEEQAQAAELILGPWKGPIIGFTQFKTILERFPYLLKTLDAFWSKLLFDRPAGEEPKAKVAGRRSLRLAETAFKPHEICALYMVRGPEITSALRLYRAKTDGFSMRAFESKVVNWKAPTILFARGKRLKKPAPDLDAAIPRVTDSNLRTSTRVAYAVITDSPWKISNRKGFAGPATTIYQLEPQLRIYTTSPGAAQDAIGFFSPDNGGIGFGLPPPQTSSITFQRNANVALLFDRFLERGVFRCIGPGGTFGPDMQQHDALPFEDRFAIANIEVWGIGDETVLAKQRREWEWDQRESQRRQNVNLGEDRSILELAGIVGQYDPNRGTN